MEALSQYLGVLNPEPCLPKHITKRLKELMVGGGIKLHLLQTTQSLLYQLLEQRELDHRGTSSSFMANCFIEAPFYNMLLCHWPSYNIRCGIWEDGIIVELAKDGMSGRSETRWFSRRQVMSHECRYHLW